MKYFVLLVGPGEMKPWTENTPEEAEAEMAQHGAFVEACAQREGVEIAGGEALDVASVTTLRTHGGSTTVTDGPFAEAAELVGGFYVLEAPDLDVVVELCEVLPAYDKEIRPVLELG